MLIYDERTQRMRYETEEECKDREFWPTVAMIVAPLVYAFSGVFF